MADEQQDVGNEEVANRLLLEYSRLGNVGQLRRVLEEGKADVNCVHEIFSARTGLLLASEMGHVECVKLLLDSKANIEHRDEEGLTGFMCACIYNRVECVKLLLACKANTDDEDIRGRTGLMRASSYGHVECVKLLLDSKVSIDQQDQDGFTGLIWASMDGNAECVKLLLASKANIHHKDLRGRTGLIEASLHGHVNCVKLLLDSKANIDERDQDGWTALMIACWNARVRCAKFFLQREADVNIAHNDGSTALTQCCGARYALNANIPLLQFLLLCCGAGGEQGKEVLDTMKTCIMKYHSELKKVLSDEVIVDTRLYVEEHGLYHEPLERVMQYCGLELMLDNDPNRNEDDPIPQLLRRRPERVRSAWYWWRQFMGEPAE